MVESLRSLMDSVGTKDRNDRSSKDGEVYTVYGKWV